MRCVVCEAWSLRAICARCQETFLPIAPKIRLLEDFKVYSFYSYEGISFLLNSKYYAIGSRIYSILARRAREYFSAQIEEGAFDGVCGVGIDDRVGDSYSHTGILLRAFSGIVRPIYGELIARNRVQYAGKNLAFRQSNPKDFSFSLGAGEYVIFDDVITTGTSMLEAKRVIERSGARVVCGIVLADART